MKVEIRKVIFTITVQKPKLLNGNGQYLLTLNPEIKKESISKREIEMASERIEIMYEPVQIPTYHLSQKIGVRERIRMEISIFIILKRRKRNGNVLFHFVKRELPFDLQKIVQNGKSDGMKNLVVFILSTLSQEKHNGNLQAQGSLPRLQPQEDQDQSIRSLLMEELMTAHVLLIPFLPIQHLHRFLLIGSN